ncbi:MAG: hypothetical protein ACK4TL_11585 [Hyphomicrobiaceae bacterium]
MRLVNLAQAEMREAMARGWAAQHLRLARSSRSRAGIGIAVDLERMKMVLDRDPPATDAPKRV